MPRDIIADPGDSEANSYAYLEDADEIADDMFDDGGWSGLDDSTRTRLLFESTKMINALRVKYPKLNNDQKLKFPVKSESGDGFDLVKEACVIQAIYLYRYANQLDYATKSSITGITGESYSAETSVSRTPAFNPYKKYAPGVISMLSDYIDMSVSLSRG